MPLACKPASIWRIPGRLIISSVSTAIPVSYTHLLAWTIVGGETMPIEVAVMEGTGKIELTGSLGDVMKESARTAISCIRTRASEYGIRHDFYSKYDIHIHVPE